MTKNNLDTVWISERDSLLDNDGVQPATDRCICDHSHSSFLFWRQLCPRLQQHSGTCKRDWVEYRVSTIVVIDANNIFVSPVWIHKNHKTITLENEWWTWLAKIAHSETSHRKFPSEITLNLKWFWRRQSRPVHLWAKPQILEEDPKTKILDLWLTIRTEDK